MLDKSDDNKGGKRKSKIKLRHGATHEGVSRIGFVKVKPMWENRHRHSD